MTSDKGELTVATIKAVAKEFDVEGVTKLSYTGKGLTRITAVDKAVNLVVRGGRASLSLSRSMGSRRASTFFIWLQG